MEPRTRRRLHEPRAVHVADPVDLRRLYDDNSRALFAYLTRRVGRSLAEDLLAETFRVAIEASAQYDRRKGSPRMWLFGIATNLVRRHWRTEQRQLLASERAVVQSRSALDPLIARLEGTAARVDAEHEARYVLRLVADLPQQDRDLLILSGWEHLNSTEIGRVLGVPAATVRSRLRRLRIELHTAMHATPTTSPPVTTPSTTGAVS